VSTLGSDALLAPLQAALTSSGLAEADLWVHRRRSAVTRFSHSSIHQNAVSDETHVHARAIIGSAIGATSGNSLEPAALRDLLARAADLARLQTPNADWPGLAAPASYRDPIAFDAGTAAFAVDSGRPGPTASSSPRMRSRTRMASRPTPR